jgi:predicted component of viral defense system (DUF524 family)
MFMTFTESKMFDAVEILDIGLNYIVQPMELLNVLENPVCIRGLGN